MSRLVQRAVLATLLMSSVALGQDAKPGAKGKPKKQAPQPAAKPEVDPREAGRERLLGAYAKEYAFLANEERVLRQRLDEQRKEREARTQALAAEIQALESSLVEKRREADAQRDRLAKLEEQAMGLDDGSATVEVVLSQVEAVRARHDRRPLPEERDLAKAVERDLGDVTQLLGDMSEIKREKGSFFLPDGREAQGEVVRIGAIGALGVSDQAAGTLAPAGDGRLQLWKSDSGAAARAAAKDTLPEVLPLYVYENLEKPAEVQQTKTLQETLNKGGIIAWVIVGVGALAALLLLVRSLLLYRAAGTPDALLAAATPHLERGDTAAALAAVAHPSAAGKVLEGVIPHMHSGHERLESAASESILQQGTRIERFGAAILVLAAIAPLLGLLGTVTGMIATFDIITVFGTGDPKLLSGGISEALITTQLGLTVAIPTLLMGNMLSGWADRIRTSMERAALRVALMAADAEPSGEVASGDAAEAEPAQPAPEAEVEAQVDPEPELEYQESGVGSVA